LGAMDIGSFAAMNQRVIATEGFDQYLPTACYPERRVLRMLEDAPNTFDLEAIALEWAMAAAEGEEEVLVAFKIDPEHFKVMRRAEGHTEVGVYPAQAPDQPLPYS
jgi:hypothetical protein